jgi:hypothetical protein
MLSDVLSDALYKIEVWQQERPEIYDGLANDIKIVVEVMDALLRMLDTFPHPALLPARNALGTAIRQLDLSAIKAAEQRLFDEIGLLSVQQRQLDAAGCETRNGMTPAQA